MIVIPEEGTTGCSENESNIWTQNEKIKNRVGSELKINSFTDVNIQSLCQLCSELNKTFAAGLLLLSLQHKREPKYCLPRRLMLHSWAICIHQHKAFVQRVKTLTLNLALL